MTAIGWQGVIWSIALFVMGVVFYVLAKPIAAVLEDFAATIFGSKLSRAIYKPWGARLLGLCCVIFAALNLIMTLLSPSSGL